MSPNTTPVASSARPINFLCVESFVLEAAGAFKPRRPPPVGRAGAMGWLPFGDSSLPAADEPSGAEAGGRWASLIAHPFVFCTDPAGVEGADAGVPVRSLGSAGLALLCRPENLSSLRLFQNGQLEFMGVAVPEPRRWRRR